LAAIVNIHDVVLATEFLPRIVGLRAGSVVFDGPATQVDRDVLTRIYGDEDWTAITQRMQDQGNKEAVEHDVVLSVA
jgi:phosphonate transport system ATP-binding protein